MRPFCHNSCDHEKRNANLPFAMCSWKTVNEKSKKTIDCYQSQSPTVRTDCKLLLITFSNSQKVCKQRSRPEPTITIEVVQNRRKIMSTSTYATLKDFNILLPKIVGNACANIESMFVPALPTMSSQCTSAPVKTIEN